jgi:group I intron endonuclease
MIGIYTITCIADNKVYVGQSQNIKFRFNIHKSHLRHKKHRNSYLQRAWDKYGENNFIFEVKEICSIGELNDKEVFWIKKLGSNHRDKGFNLTDGGDGVRGYKHTAKDKEFFSKYWTGKQTGEDNARSVLTDEDVKTIIQLLLKHVSMDKIAKTFNVSKANVQMIKEKKTWTHLTKDVVFTPRPKISKYKNISYCKSRGVFVVMFNYKGIRHFVGKFKSEEEAYAKLQEAKAKIIV